MKRTYYVLIGIAMIVFSAFHCKEGANPIDAENGQSVLRGKVVDNQGNIVQGVGVHYIFSLSSKSMEKIQKPCPSTQITYTIPKKCFVTLKILRWFTREEVETVVQDTIDMGHYSVSLNMANYTNGLYLYRLTYDTVTIEKHMALLNTDLGSLVNSIPLCKSNSDGEFSLPYGMLGFNVPLLHTGESNPDIVDTVFISHTIQLILSKQGYKTITQTMVIDTTREMSQTFRFE